ncbi:hypothetical protein QYB63_001839 [Clostridium perfringens]|nr:hypothetical protein [Clostridium perfringens]
MDRNGFKDIENFELAYKERLYEYNFINKKSSVGECRILLMHLGGIVLECYIKSIIINENKIVKSKNNKFWYNEDRVNCIEQTAQNMRKIEMKNATKKNPGHSIREAICSIGVLDEILSDRTDIELHINRIQMPFGDEREFIDLRYSNVEDKDELEKIFSEWKESFIKLKKWIVETIDISEE